MEQQQAQQQAAPAGPWQHAAPQLMGVQPQYAGATAAVHQQQQQQQQQQQLQILQQMQAASNLSVLQGRPIPGAMVGAGAPPQFAASTGAMPFAITLPGGTMIHPQFSGLAAGVSQTQQTGAAAGYPQLSGLNGSSGLTFQPGSGIPMIRGLPMTVATSLPAAAPQAHGQGQGLPLTGRHHAAALQHQQQLQQPSLHPGAGDKAKPASSAGDRPSSSHSANTSAGGLGSDGSPLGEGGSAGTPLGSGSSPGMNKSRYRGVSYDRKKAKWRVQIKVAALGKSGVSVGYFDTEEAAARAYDRAAIGLLGLDNPNLQTNFDSCDYAGESIPRLTGKTREEVKTTLKSERIKQAPRRRFTSRQRTSRYMGVGSSNRKNQWQARILVHGKVTHLGYYETEEDAARVYDRVSVALHGDHAQTNFAVGDYPEVELAPYRGLDREDLQRALGVKPMDKSSRYRGVSKKKGKWEAKVMVNRRWAYRELFDSEEEAARAYDQALWRLKPREARSYVNFKDELPPEAAAAAAAAASGFDDGTGGGGSTDGDHPGAGGGFEDDDDGSGDDDFQYEYKSTKGTRRSASMRANKRSGSAPNLQRVGGGGGGSSRPAAAFVAMPGGGMQLQFGAGPPSGMVPVGGGGGEEQLLIRVGSEVHFMPQHPPPPVRVNSASALGKRSAGLHRIQSEPQLPMLARAGDPLSAAAPAGLEDGVGAADIHDLIFDRDLFKGMGLAFGGIGGGGELPSLSDYMNQEGGAGGTPLGRRFSDSIFEDEVAALASLEFDTERPRKMSRSASMSQLTHLGPFEQAAPAREHAGVKIEPQEEDNGRLLGPLGQPIRRVATFTSSLPSCEEAEEKLAEPEGRGRSGGGLPPPPHMPSQRSSEDDLVRQLLEPMRTSAALEDALRMLGS